MFNVFELTEDFITLWEEGTFLTGVLETLYLTFISTLLAYLVGIPVGVILNITSKMVYDQINGLIYHWE